VLAIFKGTRAEELQRRDVQPENQDGRRRLIVSSLSVFGLLIPLAVLGLIAWVDRRRHPRGGDPFTLATATALYARVMLIVGVLMSLVGIGTILKAGIGFINAAYPTTRRLRSLSSVRPARAPVPPSTSSTSTTSSEARTSCSGSRWSSSGCWSPACNLFLGRAGGANAGGSPAGSRAGRCSG